MSERLDAPPVSTAKAVLSLLTQAVTVKRPDEVARHVNELYRLAPLVGLSSDWLVAQASHETDYYRSPIWDARLNPAGIGVTDGPDHGYGFKNGTDAARGQIVHMFGYVYGKNLPLELKAFATLDPRWEALLASGNLGKLRTIADLAGTWASDPRYHIGLRRHYADLIGNGSTDVAEVKKFILSAGHRNTNRGGANNEINWTYPSVVALKQAIEARGGKAWIVQEEDGDSDKTFYLNGGLQQAARKCVDLAAKYGPFNAYISSHYNGGASPGFHAIFPDAAGDSKAMNVQDVRLCRRIRDKVKATGTVGMLSWTADSPGVMSEKETGVGAQGYRLGEFVGTLGFRTTTARVIIEAGSIDVARERAYINNPQWVRHVYAEAIVDALEEEYGKFGGTVPTTTPAPQPQYDPVVRLAALDAFKDRPESDVPLYVVDDTGNTWFTVMREVTFTDATARAQKDDLSGKVGDDVAAGDTAYIMFARYNDGKLVGYSNWGTRFDLTKTDAGIPQ